MPSAHSLVASIAPGQAQQATSDVPSLPLSLLATVSRLKLPSRLPPSASAYPLPLQTSVYSTPSPSLVRPSDTATSHFARCTPHTSYLRPHPSSLRVIPHTPYQPSSLSLRTSYLINRRPALFPFSTSFLCCLRPPRSSGLACLYPYFTLYHCDCQP